MAKERMINTRIWSDTWVSNLDPIEKLLFVYFLTNTYTNISGIYELPMKVAAVETGIDPSMFEKILPHLEPKIIYKHGWVILPNFPKYQNTENPKIMAGIQRELGSVPKEIHTLSIAYGYPIALIPIPIPNSISGAELRVEPFSLKEEWSEPREETGRVTGKTRAAYETLLQWAEKERGSKFVHRTKQYKALKDAKAVGLKAADLRGRWEEMANDEFWDKKGFDWTSVVASFNRKGV